MKNFIFLFSFLTLFLLFAGCKTFYKQEYSQDELIASQISTIDDIESYSDETIKTLSVLYRTNIDQLKTNTPTNFNQRIYNLVNETSNEKLEKKIEFNVYKNEWSEIINKSDILEFLKIKEISLSNLSKYEIIKDCNNNAISLVIASKKLAFTDFAKYFKLKSNNNIHIKNYSNYIKISGYGQGFNNIFDIKDIETLANLGKNYLEILKKISTN